MATKAKKAAPLGNKPKEKKAKASKELKKRVPGHAEGKIYESPDCWDDDFNN